MAIVEGSAYWAAVTTPNTKYEPAYTVNLAVSPHRRLGTGGITQLSTTVEMSVAMCFLKKEVGQ